MKVAKIAGLFLICSLLISGCTSKPNESKEENNSVVSPESVVNKAVVKKLIRIRNIELFSESAWKKEKVGILNSIIIGRYSCLMVHGLRNSDMDFRG